MKLFPRFTNRRITARQLSTRIAPYATTPPVTRQSFELERAWGVVIPKGAGALGLELRREQMEPTEMERGR